MTMISQASARYSTIISVLKSKCRMFSFVEVNAEWSLCVTILDAVFVFGPVLGVKYLVNVIYSVVVTTAHFQGGGGGVVDLADVGVWQFRVRYNKYCLNGQIGYIF
jgi:hypothetical protein